MTVLCYTCVLEQTSLWTDSKLVKLWGGVVVLCTSVRCLLRHLLPKVGILTWDGAAWLEQAFNSKNIPPYHSYTIFICHVNIGWRPVSSLKHGSGLGRGLATHVCLRGARTAVNDWSAACEREPRLTRSRSILFDACFSRACTGLSVVDVWCVSAVIISAFFARELAHKLETVLLRMVKWQRSSATKGYFKSKAN